MSYYRTQPLICKKVDATEARRYLEVNNFPGQRNLNNAKANQYALLMSSGRMRPVDVDMALCPGGIRYMMNGQHVCTAICVYGKPFDARIQHWKCDTLEDAWHLFGTFDVHAARTEGQIIKAARPFLPGMEDVPLRLLRACATALATLQTDPPIFTGLKMVKTEKADLLAPHIDQVMFAQKMHDLCGNERVAIMRTPAITAMIATYRRNKTKSEAFWTDVCSGEMLTKDMPQYKLGALLLTGDIGATSVIGGNTASKLIYTHCISYWNTWVTGGNRRSVKARAMKSIPKVEG